MKVISIILISALSGIFAGMGMGGGTFLIPLLSLIFNYEQAICQSTNVICFIILGVMCFFIYKKKNLIDFKTLLLVALPACLISLLFTFFSVKIHSNILKIAFSVFIIIFGIIFFLKNAFIMFLTFKKNKNR